MRGEELRIDGESCLKVIRNPSGVWSNTIQASGGFKSAVSPDSFSLPFPY